MKINYSRRTGFSHMSKIDVTGWNLMLINYLSFLYSWSSIATDPDLLLKRTVAVGVGRLGRHMKKGLEKDRLQNKTKNLRRKFELFKCAQFHDLQKVKFYLFSVIFGLSASRHSVFLHLSAQNDGFIP